MPAEPASQPGSDICACGDYRSQPAKGGRCSICYWSDFEFSYVATGDDLATWNKYHDNVVQMPPVTFVAKLFTAKFGTGEFKTAGTLDGYIDLALPEGGTYQLSIDEAE